MERGVLLFLFTDGIKRDVTSKGTRKEICSFCTAEGNRKKQLQHMERLMLLIYGFILDKANTNQQNTTGPGVDQ